MKFERCYRRENNTTEGEAEDEENDEESDNNSSNEETEKDVNEAEGTGPFFVNIFDVEQEWYVTPMLHTLKC
jgi:hypothetical protein